LALHLPEAAGPVPVYYSLGFESRALHFQSTLASCKAWYEQEVKVHADITMAVLDKADWQKATRVSYPIPHSFSTVIILPARFEDFPQARLITNNIQLLVDGIVCHEAGHTYASKLNMPTGDGFLAEMYANIFRVSFVRARRPDIASAFLDSPPPNLGRQRYTSMEDFQYLYSDVGMANTAWFQFQVNHMCDLLLKGKSLAVLLSQLKSAFQDTTPRPFRVVAAKLEAIDPGLSLKMGQLWRPTTLPEAKPGSCARGIRSLKASALVVQNRSSKPVELVIGGQPMVTVQPNSWATVRGQDGELVRADQGSCFVIGHEPVIARLPAA
jgi:hypothetical protein